MAVLKWLPAAQDDLARLHAFIEPHSSKAAVRAIRTIVNAAKSLEEFPEKGKPWVAELDFRELVVNFGARGYIIRYRLFADEIIIVRVWHSLEDR